MAIRSHPIVCSFRRLAPNFSKGSRVQAETGITLIELVVAISVMGFVALGALAFVQLGASAKRAVGKEIRYSQELSLMSAQIIDGAGVRYRGLREASDVSSREEHGCKRYTFFYPDSEASDQEHYWADSGMLYRSKGTRPAEQVGLVGDIEVSGPNTKGICTLRLAFCEPGSCEVEHVTSVCLRNYSH